MQVDTLLLDIGDTLIPASQIARFALAKTVSNFMARGLHTQQMDFPSAFLAANDIIEGPDVNHLFSSARIIEHACCLAAIEPSHEFVQAFLSFYQSTVREQLRPNPDLRRLLNSLRATGILIGVVTDGTKKEQTETLQRIHVLDLIDVVITSEYLGVEKPDAAMFTTALDKLGNTDPARAIMVGDSLSRDIAGACDVGMQTALITEHVRPSDAEIAEFKPDFVIDTLANLPTICTQAPGGLRE